MGSSLKSNSMGRPNDQGWKISPRYARKREEIFVIVQFICSILRDIVYVYILHRLMKSKWFLKVTHTSYNSTLNVAFLKALSLITCFFFKFPFHVHFSLTHKCYTISIFASALPLHLLLKQSTYQTSNKINTIFAPPLSQASAQPCWVTMWEGEHGFCLFESLLITCK